MTQNYVQMTFFFFSAILSQFLRIIQVICPLFVANHDVTSVDGGLKSELLHTFIYYSGLLSIGKCGKIRRGNKRFELKKKQDRNAFQSRCMSDMRFLEALPEVEYILG